jgi:AmmeMemoRadiSam system protein B
MAGQFYTDDPATLREEVRDYLAHARGQTPRGRIKAVIAPHAGYAYSGPVAGSAFAPLRDQAGTIQRVILLGPSHRVAFHGVAASEATGFGTPLGVVPVDTAAVEAVIKAGQARIFESAHRQEHSLEVELPFLQEMLEKFSIVPLVVGELAGRELVPLLEALWGGDETLIVISSDLSHFLDYEAATALDARTCAAIEALDPDAIGYDQACGRIPIQGLLHAAAVHRLRATTLDLRNSADTAGGKDRVVGYGAWVFT